MKRNLEHWFAHEPGSGQEVLLAVLPFLLTGFLIGLLSLIPGVDQFPMWAGQLILLGLFLVQASLGIIGLVLRLPRWSLPYAGVLVVLFSFGGLILLDVLGIFPRPQGAVAYLSVVLFLSVYLFVICTVVILGVWFSGKVSHTRQFYNQVKVDRTLLSFMMYGGSLVFVLVSYEDTSQGGAYLMLSALAMVIGGWVYLRQTSLLAKMGALAL